MASLHLKVNDKIEGWDHDEDQSQPCSHNMLRILQNKINNPARVKQRQQIYNRKLKIRSLNTQRPATGNIRFSSNKSPNDQLQSHQTIDLCQGYQNFFNNSQQKLFKEGKQQMSIKFNSRQMRNQVKNVRTNKQNCLQKQFTSLNDKLRQKLKGEELQIKKQQLIFNSQPVKNKNFENNIKKFHQLQIKLRKNRLHTNQTKLSHRQKIHVLIQSYGKGNQIKISQVQISQKGQEQNLKPLGFQKYPEGHYTKLSRKNKFTNKQKDSNKKQNKKETDLFADSHLADQSLQIRNII